MWANSGCDLHRAFDGVKSLPWEDYIGKYDAFPVNGRSIDSALFSIPDCQSIVKKAIVERLKQKYHISHFEETGAEYRVRFFIHKNVASLMIDTSGEGLHKRGYRRKSNDATAQGNARRRNVRYCEDIPRYAYVRPVLRQRNAAY